MSDCLPCQAAAAAAAANMQSYRVTTTAAYNETAPDCAFTDEVLLVWKQRLEWFKSGGRFARYGYDPELLNRFIGLVQTSINIKKKCTYDDILSNQVSAWIAFIETIYGQV